MPSEWTKASGGNDGGDCVEVKAVGEEQDYGTKVDSHGISKVEVLIRDSKGLDAEPLSFTRAEWESFRDGVKAGDFDHI